MEEDEERVHRLSLQLRDLRLKNLYILTRQLAVQYDGL